MSYELWKTQRKGIITGQKQLQQPNSTTLQVAAAAASVLCKQNQELWLLPLDISPCVSSLTIPPGHSQGTHFQFLDWAQTQTRSQRQRVDWNKQDISDITHCC